jgi:hypothetical protein
MHVMKVAHQGIEAARVLREDHDVLLQHPGGVVPRAVRLAQEADELAGHLGLRLAEANGRQQRLQCKTKLTNDEPQTYKARLVDGNRSKVCGALLLDLPLLIWSKVPAMYRKGRA